jgi:hypothetical protein
MRMLLLFSWFVIAASVTTLPATAAPPAWELQWALPGITEARGLTRDSQNHIYAVDGLGSVILKYDADGNLLGILGSEGSGDGQLQNPNGIASDGTVLYVADQGNNRIQKLSASGSFLGAWGDSGSADGEFVYLIDVEVAGGGDVYTLDGPYPGTPQSSANYRVQRFTTQGTFVQAWGKNGNNPGEFGYAGGLAIDSQWNVYVSDAGNYRVQKFSSSGVFLRQWAAGGTGIDADEFGNIYLVDRTNARMLQFTSEGTPLSTWGSQGPDPGEFETPLDVTTSSAGDVYVSDNQPRIQRFASTTPVEPTTWGSVKTRYPR